MNAAYYLAYPNKFTLGEKNMRAVAWMTDTTNTEWTQYKDAAGKAEWAIASPTIELFVASFNAKRNNLTVPEPKSDGTGYTNSWKSNFILPSNFRHEIYRKGSSNWWLASPGSDGSVYCFEVYGSYGYIDSANVAQANLPVRPVVCIPTSVFNAAVDAETYTLTDE